MWTKIKNFFTVGTETQSKSLYKSKEKDYAQLLILKQIMSMHSQGKVVFPKGGLPEQEQRLLEKARGLGFTSDNLEDLSQEINQYRADKATGKV
tara:strand:+ start:158 stop:439 length:282 start_codon:yes stop_codon:yes gene_type:complete